MRNQVLLAGLLVGAMLPAHALAQESCQERAANRAAGTAFGAVAGAVIGSQLAGRGDRTTGAVIGGVAGGVIGNQLAKGPQDCEHAYGWYDNDGRWHANSVDRAVAAGYYDRNGGWVDGAPPGYQYAPPSYRRPEERRDDRRERGPDPAWAGYPDFRDREQRIASLILGGIGAGAIDPGDGRDLMHQLGDIRVEEAREYRSHGSDLPYGDRDRINSELRQLDRRVDQARRTE